MENDENVSENDRETGRKNTGHWKPDYASMVLRPVLKLGLWSGFILLILIGGALSAISVGSGLNLVVLTPLLLIYLGMLSGLGYWHHVRWKKSEYELTDDRLRMKTGTLISDSDGEVLWSKVVQPRLEISFIQQTFFGSGDIYVEAAGQSETEIEFVDLAEPEAMLARVLDHLNEPVSLEQDNLSETRQQSGRGIAIDLLLANVFFTFPLLAIAAGGAIFMGLTTPTTTSILFGLFLFWNIYPIYSALVKQNTCYHIYEHYVVSEVDFLGVHRGILPLSVLTDVNFYAPFHKRLFGISHLHPSVPGLGDQMPLVNLADGMELKSVLQNRSDQIKGIDGNTGQGADKRYTTRPQFQCYLAFPFLSLVAGGLLSIGIYYGLSGLEMKDLPGYTLPLAALAPAFLTGIYFLWSGLKWWATEFSVKRNRVEYRFTFFSKTITSLSTDKLMAVIESQGIIERLFGVYSVEFHSIGTAKDIIFSAINNTQENTEMIRHIREYEGSYGGTPTQSIKPELTWNGLIFQHPIATIVLPLVLLIISGFSSALPAIILETGFTATYGPVILALGLLFTGLVTGGILAYYTFYYNQCVKLDLYDNYLTYSDGYFFTRDFHVTYNDIRNVEYGREPFSDDGWVRVDYAGGSAGESAGNDQSKTGFVSTRGFMFRHLPQVHSMARALEDVFSGETEPNEVTRRSRELSESDDTTHRTVRPIALPYIGSGIFFGVMGYLWIFGELSDIEYVQQMGSSIHAIGILGGGAIGGIALWIYHRFLTYAVREEQVEKQYWLIFTRTKSIKFLNIDNIETNRGLLDKFLGTGTIQITTTGGGGVEMSIRYIRNYKKLYEVMQDVYNEVRSREDI